MQAVVNWIIVNSIVLENRLNAIDIIKVKILAIKYYSREKSKLKGFLI